MDASPLFCHFKILISFSLQTLNSFEYFLFLKLDHGYWISRFLIGSLDTGYNNLAVTNMVNERVSAPRWLFIIPYSARPRRIIVKYSFHENIMGKPGEVTR